ncbi:MAG TPA: hypothetical protein VG935_01255 [Patescibacteria group bacterium]|nr:hypothetical protein [Patescibacteria group bacterium]
MKYIGFVVLIIILFASLFKLFGADLTNNVTAVALMVLLLSVFSDLKEFNFWGLTGTRDLKENLQNLQGKPALKTDNLPKVSKAKVQQAQMNTEVVSQSGSSKSNFLELFFEIEKLLRTVASVVKGSTISASMNLNDLAVFLSDKNILTEDGVSMLGHLKTLRDQIVAGDEKLADDVVTTGITIANELYADLKTWIQHPQKA